MKKTILKTLEKLADHTFVLEAMLDGLKPDVMYQITVAAFNQVGRGTVKSVTATTDQEGRVIIMITAVISCSRENRFLCLENKRGDFGREKNWNKNDC